MTLLGFNQIRWGRLAIAALSVVAAASPLSAQTSLTGAGATFPAPIYQKWFADYQSIGNVQINYQPNGSGGGIKAVTDGTTDFGASDMPMTDEQIAVFKKKNGHGILLFPTVLGAVVPVYNVSGVSGELNFPGTVLADIFLGKITSWDDAALAKANPGVTACGKDCGGSPFGRQWHVVLFYRLFVKGKSRMEHQSGQEYFSRVAHRVGGEKQ
jgi:ABC-type phosphate transport system substrate-binding protein